MTNEWDKREQIWGAILAERHAQDLKWGGPENDDKNGDADWVRFIQRHLLKAVDKPFNIEKFRKQMIRVAALAVAALEAIDRRESER